MSSFTIGGGSAAHKARDLQDGVRVIITDASVEKSRFTQVIQKGPNAGQEVPKHQLKVVLTHNGAAYSQYLGGVYPRGEGYTFTEDGGAGAFMKSLKDAGLPIGSELASIIGLEFVTKRVSGGVGKMAYVHIHAAPGTPTSNPAAPKPTVAVKATAKATVTPNAFDALSQADRDLLIDATKDGTTLLPQEVVEAGIAKDTTQATAILDGLAAHRTVGSRLARK